MAGQERIKGHSTRIALAHTLEVKRWEMLLLTFAALRNKN